MIDVETRNSPGWWLQQLHRKLNAKQARQNTRPEQPVARSRNDRLDWLWSYFVGNPPLPSGSENNRALFEAFVRKSRANYASLVVEAPLNRMRLLGVRSAADDDHEGDDLARGIADANEFSVLSKDIHAWMFAMGESYVIVGPGDDADDAPVVTAEDPRQVITAHDPARESKVIAALKTYRDEDEGRDYAHVFTPGRCDVYYREKASPGISQTFTLKAWRQDEERSGPYEQDGTDTLVPVTRFLNRFGMAEFESNTDLLDRINDTILRRMVITTLQAFRQRAAIGDLPDVDPVTGKEIDYNEIFSADPGSLWKLPTGGEIWESGQADLTSILTSVKDDVRELAASTQTPLHMITPDAAQGSAEGASLMREGLVYKVEDRQERVDPRWIQVNRHMFLFAGDTARAKGKLSTIWAPVERYSLAERGSAAAQAATSLPMETIWTDIWQIAPERISGLRRQWDEQQLMAAPPAAAPGG